MIKTWKEVVPAARNLSEAFVQDIVAAADSGSEDLRLIYADWLEEQGFKVHAFKVRRTVGSEWETDEEEMLNGDRQTSIWLMSDTRETLAYICGHAQAGAYRSSRWTSYIVPNVEFRSGVIELSVIKMELIKGLLVHEDRGCWCGQTVK